MRFRLLWLIFTVGIAFSAASQTFSGHLRVAPRRGAYAGWSDAAGKKVVVEFREVRPDNDWSTLELRVRYGKDTRQVVWPAGIPFDAVSLIIDADTDSTHLTLAYSRDRVSISLPAVLGLSAEPVTITDRCKVLRDDHRLIDAPEPAPTAPFATIAELTDYIENSTDPRECLWRYYDSNTRPLKATVGSQYTLATIKDAAREGAYLIILVDGFAPSDLWHVLDVKGNMTPSGVDGVYDLEWLTTDRIPLSHHSWAMYGTEGLLTLSFPQWEATMRFAPM